MKIFIFHYRKYTKDFNSVWDHKWKLLVSRTAFSHCLFFVCVFSHHDYSQRARAWAAFVLKLSFCLCSQSLHPLQLHSSFLLVFNLSSFALSVLACSALQCKHNLFWGEVNYWSRCCHSLRAEVGRRGRMEAVEGGTRVDERNGEDRFVKEGNEEGFRVQRWREI